MVLRGIYYLVILMVLLSGCQPYTLLMEVEPSFHPSILFEFQSKKDSFHVYLNERKDQLTFLTNGQFNKDQQNALKGLLDRAERANAFNLRVEAKYEEQGLPPLPPPSVDGISIFFKKNSLRKVDSFRLYDKVIIHEAVQLLQALDTNNIALTFANEDCMRYITDPIFKIIQTNTLEIRLLTIGYGLLDIENAVEKLPTSESILIDLRNFENPHNYDGWREVFERKYRQIGYREE
ncbi:MAG: hypothetical protein KDC24_09595 [Saprospiraceae bacterium]|nr:hypothetical protein [Saprospiraceae bacterium]